MGIHIRFWISQPYEQRMDAEVRFVSDWKCSNLPTNADGFVSPVPSASLEHRAKIGIASIGRRVTV
ncbi:MAG: hypothetical protein OXG24_10860 [Gammaproteobacteria bacterium]|nr:hypothetical protein [Gammaproteobacteria bacterium]